MIRRISLILAIALIVPSVARAQWAAPTQAPPGGNTSTPINTSATAQTKTGAFTASGGITTNGFINNGGSYFVGNVGIGTASAGSSLHVYKGSGNSIVSIENTGNGNTSGIDFIRQRSSGTGVGGGSIFMQSDTSGNNAFLYLQAQSASAQSGVTGALTAGNGVRLVLRGGTGAATLEYGNLGIATTTPLTALAVGGTITTTGGIRFADGTTQTSAASGSGTVGGTGTANYISKWTAASTQGNSLIYDNGTNVGIGTASPTSPLHVVGSVRSDTNFVVSSRAQLGAGTGASDGRVLAVGNLELGTSNSFGTGANMTLTTGGNIGVGTASPSTGLHVNSDTGLKVSRASNSDQTLTLLGGNGGGLAQVNSSYDLRLTAGGSSSYGAVSFATGATPTETMRITNAGNVGIGTTTPEAKLNVAGNFYVNSSGNTTGGLYYGGATNGLIVGNYASAPWPGTNGLYVGGTTDLIGKVGLGTTASGNDKLEVNQNWFDNSSTDFGGGLRLQGDAPTVSFYETDNTTNKFMIHNSAGVLNFYRRPNGGAWDQMAYFNASGELYETHAMYAPAFYYSSDRNLKKNIVDLDGKTALDKVLSLQGVSFDWKKDGSHSVGLIAQDVEKVYPELVNTNKDTGLKSVEYANLVAPLIEAVKEQQKQIDELKAEVEALKAR